MPAQALAGRCRGTENGPSSPTAALVTKFSGTRVAASARTDVPAQAVAHRSFAGDLHDLPFNTTIMHINIQGLRSHLAELSAVIRLHCEPPDIVCVNETFLDDGVEQIELEGFDVVGQRDRSYSGDERSCGGVIVFARAEIADHATLLVISEVAERLWIQLHTNN